MNFTKEEEQLIDNFPENDSEEKEHILCAAIWIDDGKIYEDTPKNIKIGHVVAGFRHESCFATIKNLDRLKKSANPQQYILLQGYITNLNRFVDRAEGYKIALNAGQIKFSLNSIDKKNPTLVSKNLY